ncbi:MAG: biotin--[acetyl-CoA-carboxylase] ligase [Mariprofundus sp.]|nr:biotin--[acetyl-CoA-carboxylase] ligase [Mariprofundus sp.]
MVNDALLTSEGLRACLPLAMKHIGRRLLLVEQTGSTNQDVISLAEQGEAGGLVLVAERQSDGRGRLGRCWHTLPDSLAVSILLRPALALQQVPQLSLLMAVALHDVLKVYLPELTIKWPNDLIYDGAKLAGILSEMRSGAVSPPAVVLGFGINLKPPVEGYPSDVSQAAIDLATASGCSISRLHLLAALLGSVDQWYELYLQQGFQPVREAWWQAHAASDQPVRVYDGRSYIYGIAKKLDQDGALLLETAHGIERIIAGELEII